MLRQTPLHATHVALGARMIDFGGWDMPIQYEGIIPEVEATRKRVGIFDIGHMGRLEIVGPDHLAAVDWVLTCHVEKLALGRVKYGFILTDEGTVIDDVLAYRDEDRTHVVVNAGNRTPDRDRFREQVEAKGFACKVIDAADPDEPALGETFLGACQHMIALQGPRSEDLLARVADAGTDARALRYYRMMRGSVIGVPCLISRTGYTGEDGYELFMDEKESTRIWDVLMAQGEDLGIAPIGLGARDTLRTEAGMPLYGNELDRETTPVEAGLFFGLSLDKGNFVGRDVLVRQKEGGVTKTLVAFEVDTRRVPRHGCPLLGKDGAPVGVVTSGTWSPTLDKNIAMGYVPPSLAGDGAEFDVDIRGKVHGCKVVPLPFYKRPK